MIRKNRIYLLTALFLIGCSGSKQTTQTEPLPEWVQAKPVSNEYYIGVGSAIKTNNVNDYQATAKNNALSDLASEISLNVSTTSVLHQLENSFGFSEDFYSDVQTSTDKQLEGYERVSTFENSTNYWVYYRLSKALYQSQQEKLRNQVMSVGTDYYTKALEQSLKNDFSGAIVYYLKGLESIKAYFSDALETTVNGKTIYLGNELISGLINLINQIKVIPVKSELSIKQAQGIPSSDLIFNIINQDKQPLTGLPVIFYLGDKPLRNNKTETNMEGQVSYSFDQLVSKSGVEYFEAQIDLLALAQQATSDPMFRKILRKIDAPKGQIRITVKKPSFYIISNELNLGQEMSPKIVQNKIIEILTGNGFTISGSRDLADYTLEISLNTSQDKKEGRFFYVNLTGDIKLFNTEKQLLLLKPIDQIQGVQLSYPDAGIDAYSKLGDYLSKHLLQKLKEAIK